MKLEPTLSLWPLFLNHKGRVIHKWKHYFPVYERHFWRFVGQPFLFIEIGCGEGGSLQLWKQYFGPLATIVGLDIRSECKEFEEDQIHVMIGDQSDPEFLMAVVAEFGAPSIVLDDGSHMMQHIKVSFDCLYPRIPLGGIYMVEDLHTAYWEEYGGGLKRDGSFIEFCKDMIDHLNADHTRGAIPESEFARSTLSMHIYDSIVIFEKGSYGRKFAPQIGEVAKGLT
jgi:hypothetical protein